MASNLRSLLRFALPLGLVLGTSAAAGAAALHVLPASGSHARGLRIDGATVPPGADLRSFIAQRANTRESAPVRITLPGRKEPVVASFADLGLRIDVDQALQRAMAIGRTGPIEERIDQSLRARAGDLDLQLTWKIGRAHV